MPDHDVTAREAVLADPLLGEVRRRHPDVDIVLLPAPPAPPAGPDDDGAPPAAEPEPLTADDLAALVAHDDHEVERALDGVAPPLEHAPRWSAGTRRGTLVRRSLRAVGGLSPAAADDLVTAVTAALEQHGWRVDPRAAGHVRCRATAAGGTLAAQVLHVVETGRVAVSVVGGPYPVSAELARELRRQQRPVDGAPS